MRLSLKKQDDDFMLIDLQEDKNDGNTPLHKNLNMNEEEYEELDQT